MPLHANEFATGDLMVAHPWAMPLPPVSPNGAAYLTITNRGQNPDKLVAADSPIADKVEVHEHVHENGAMKMQEVEGGLEISGGEIATFEPGGLHLMLIGLKEPLVEGQTFPVTLQFEQAGPLEVTVNVQQKSDSGMSGSMEHSGHNMDKSKEKHSSHGSD